MNLVINGPGTLERAPKKASYNFCIIKKKKISFMQLYLGLKQSYAANKIGSNRNGGDGSNFLHIRALREIRKSSLRCLLNLL